MANPPVAKKAKRAALPTAAAAQSDDAAAPGQQQASTDTEPVQLAMGQLKVPKSTPPSIDTDSQLA